MRIRAAIAGACALIVTGVLAGSSAATTATSYKAVSLGTLGGSSSYAIAMNAGGRVAGWSTIKGDAEERAFSWTQADGMVDLGTLGGSMSRAAAINSTGQIVGRSRLATDLLAHAFLWTPGGHMIDLGTLGGTSSWANDVNDAGQVVGAAQYVQYSPLSNDTHAFAWTATGGMSDLGTLGGSSSEARAVSSRGQVVGSSFMAPGSFEVHAFSWTPGGGMVDLGTLGGSISMALGVTAAGEVFGWSLTSASPSSPAHVFSWTAAGGMVDLGTLDGPGAFAQMNDEPFAVNALGQVAGYSETAPGGPQHAVVGTRSGGLVDLGTLGGTMAGATAVNTAGQAVGWSLAADSREHAFTWTPSTGMLDLGTFDNKTTAAVAVNDAGQIAGNAGFFAGKTQALVWLRKPPTVHMTLIFTGVARTIVWDGDSESGDLTVEHRADGTLNSVTGSGQLAGGTSVTSALARTGAGQMMSGSLTATRGSQKLSVQKIIGLASTDRVYFTTRATYYDGRNTVFGDLTLMVTDS